MRDRGARGRGQLGPERAGCRQPRPHDAEVMPTPILIGSRVYAVAERKRVVRRALCCHPQADVRPGPEPGRIEISVDRMTGPLVGTPIGRHTSRVLEVPRQGRSGGRNVQMDMPVGRRSLISSTCPLRSWASWKVTLPLPVRRCRMILKPAVPRDPQCRRPPCVHRVQ